MPTVTIQQKTLKLARVCLPLFQDARRSAIIHGVSDRPTDSTALAFAFDRYDQFRKDGGLVLWDVLKSLPPARFDIPEYFDCDIRYSTTLTGAALLRRLADFRDELSALPAFHSDSRKVYLNLAVRVVLMFGYAIEHEKDFRDVLIVAGTDPEPVEVFEPSDLYPNGTNAPEDLGDTLDPSIFDDAARNAGTATVLW